MTALLALLAGLVLDANPQWFNGADTVGVILIIVGGIGLVIQLLLFVGVIGAATRS